jgi:Cu-Zn family superoxide dismutase
MEANVTRAICVMNNPDLNIKGTVKFEDSGEVTKIWINFTGMTPGKHGFHIHEFGNLTNACHTAGAHYNPYKKTHGGPEDEERHVGDLGNVTADENGNVSLELEDKLIKLTGEYSVIGRSCVVHENEDDLGKGGFSDSLTTGHAGGRSACGIIGITQTF